MPADKENGKKHLTNLATCFETGIAQKRRRETTQSEAPATNSTAEDPAEEEPAEQDPAFKEPPSKKSKPTLRKGGKAVASSRTVGDA